MANIQVVNPFQNFVGLNSVPVQNGYIYIGVENQDPESYPQAVYWDSALTIPAAQPIRTTGGYISNAGTPGQLFTANKYSIRVKDSTGALVFYSASSAFSGSYLPLAGGAMSGAIDFAKGADIASNTLTDIGAATGNYVTVTGTTTITALGTAQAGAVRWIRFAAALTITHSSPAIVMPDGISITTAAGDVAVFVSDGGGNWRCVGYSRPSATIAPVPGAYRNIAFKTNGTGATFPVTADYVIVDDGATASKLLRNFSATINTAGTGANGLDTGAIAASTWYYVYAIYNPSTATTAGLFSLSATAPTLPTGYTMAARIGTFRTDGTANKYPLLCANTNADAQYKWAAATNMTGPVIVANTTGVVTWPTTISLSSVIPPTATRVRGWVYAAPLSGQNMGISPYNTVQPTTTNGPVYVTSNVATASPVWVPFDFALDSQNLYYYSTGVTNGLSIAIIGWKDSF